MKRQWLSREIHNLRDASLSVSRDGIEIGEWPSAAVLDLLNSGFLRESDYYWRAGMTDLRPLDSILQPKFSDAVIKAKEEESKALAHGVGCGVGCVIAILVLIGIIGFIFLLDATDSANQALGQH